MERKMTIGRFRVSAAAWRGACAWAAAFVLAAAASVPASAQSGPEVSFFVQPNVLQLGEVATARFEISGIANPPVPTLPSLPNFQVDSTPSRGLQTQVANGRLLTSTITYSYRIMPRRQGTFTIGPIEYRAEGRRYTLPAVEVRVGAAPEATGAADGNESQALEDLLFAKLSASKESAYVQEAVTLILSVYSRQLDLGRDFALNNLPQAGITLGEFRELGAEREIMDGQVYTVRRFYATCRGLTSGLFRFEPVLSVPVRIRRNANPSSRRSPFDQLFLSAAVETRKIDIDPEPLTLTILPLPTTDRPRDFSGAVGSFQFSASAQPREIDVGSPITLTMEIRGQGNLDSISAPQLDLGDEFKRYDPRLIDKRDSGARDSGSKTFEQVIIPRDPAITEIPRLSFSFFDPDAAAYRTLEQGPFRIVVNPASNAAARVVEAAPASESLRELKVLEEDIAYLKPPPERWLHADRTRSYRSALFLGMQLAPPLCALALFAFARRRDSLASDQIRSRRRRAPKQAEEGLRRVRAAVEARDNRSFFEAVWDALAAYFADRLNLSPGEVTGDQVALRFQQGGMNAQDLDRLRRIFDRCEQARFGLGFSSQSTMTDEDHRSAELLERELESVVRLCEEVKV